MVRKGAAKDSKKVGGLEKGEVIVALSTEETDGTVRVEFERGWVSVTAASGKVLLELMPDEPAAAPIPAPPSSDQRPSSSLRPKRRVNVPTSPAGNVPAPPTSPPGAAPIMRPQRTPSNRTSAPVDTDSDSDAGTSATKRDEVAAAAPVPLPRPSSSRSESTAGPNASVRQRLSCVFLQGRRHRRYEAARHRRTKTGWRLSRRRRRWRQS